MINLEDTKARMQKAIEFFASDISSIRTGKASGTLVENIIVSAYGGAQRLKIMELASIAVSDPQTITITPWDGSIIGDIKKGILEANVGLNPSVDGGILRLSVPPLSAERRQEFVKLLHQKMEEAKVSVRKIRHDLMGEIKRAQEDKDITEDDRERIEKQLQDETDKAVAKIEDLGEKKEQELMTI
jgi:ribosome recycling factor